MNLFNLITRKQQGKDILLMVVVGKIYFWDGRKVRKAGGSGYANSIAEHNGEIFEGSIGGIRKFSSVHDEYIGELIREKDSVLALCSHDGFLYDAIGGSPDDVRYEIHETLTDKLVATRENSIRALVSHNGKLYDGGWYGVYETFANTKISDRFCETLCSHDGILYDAGMVLGVYNTFTGELVAERTMPAHNIHALCSHNGMLLDAAEGRREGIRDTLNDRIVLTYDKFRKARLPYRSPTTAVNDMISIKPEILKEAMEVKNG